MPLVAKKTTRSELSGTGCLMQIVAMMLPFIGTIEGAVGAAIGIVLSLVLFITGTRKLTCWYCEHCGNRLPDPHVRTCPGCHAEFL